MSIIFKGIVTFSLLLSLSKADTNDTIKDETGYIDKTHRYLSQSVIEWSDRIDTMISNWLDKNETNATGADRNNTSSIELNNTKNSESNSTETSELNATAAPLTYQSTASKVKKSNYTAKVPLYRTKAVPEMPENRSPLAGNVAESTLEDRVRSTDSFFQSEKYLNETDNTYIRVRIENYFQSKESSDFGLTLRAQMPFTKSRQNLKIFLDNMTLDNAHEILKDKDEAPDIGINYFDFDKMIHSIYSVGFSGIDPFVRARYNMPVKTEEWLIDLVQLFRYSIDDKFEEETNIYFDKEVGKESLFRVQLYRKTQEDIAGMDYALFLQYYRTLSRHTGYGIGQAFIGNTKYEYTAGNGIEPFQRKEYAGINSYVTSFSWRTNVWRKWFFVEVHPSVSFDKQYDYEPNYQVRLFFDLYLGNFN